MFPEEIVIQEDQEVDYRTNLTSEYFNAIQAPRPYGGGGGGGGGGGRN